MELRNERGDTLTVKFYMNDKSFILTNGEIDYKARLTYLASKETQYADLEAFALYEAMTRKIGSTKASEIYNKYYSEPYDELRDAMTHGGTVCIPKIETYVRDLDFKVYKDDTLVYEGNTALMSEDTIARELSQHFKERYYAK